jgi:hypothetical protein
MIFLTMSGCYPLVLLPSLHLACAKFDQVRLAPTAHAQREEFLYFSNT